MRGTPQFGGEYINKNNVKMSLTRGISAWIQIFKLINPSETTRSAFQRGNTKYRATQ